MVHRRRPEKVKVVDMAIRTVSEEYNKTKAEQYQNVTWKEIDEGFESLENTTTRLKMARTNYVRQLVLVGRLEGVKVEMRGFNKWFVERSSIDYYLQHKKRQLSMRRYLLRINPDDEAEVRNALFQLVEQGTISSYSLDLAYKSKQNEQEG